MNEQLLFASLGIERKADERAGVGGSPYQDVVKDRSSVQKVTGR